MTSCHPHVSYNLNRYSHSAPNLTPNADRNASFLHLLSMGGPRTEVEPQAQLFRSPLTAAQVFDDLTPAQRGAHKMTTRWISWCQSRQTSLAFRCRVRLCLTALCEFHLRTAWRVAFTGEADNTGQQRQRNSVSQSFCSSLCTAGMQWMDSNLWGQWNAPYAKNANFCQWFHV